MADGYKNLVMGLVSQSSQEAPSLTLLERQSDLMFTKTMDDEREERLAYIEAYMGQLPLASRNESRAKVAYGEPPKVLKPVLGDVVEYYLYYGRIRELFVLFSGTPFEQAFEMVDSDYDKTESAMTVVPSDWFNRLRSAYTENCNATSSRGRYVAIVRALRNDPMNRVRGRASESFVTHMHSMFRSSCSRLLYAAARGGFPFDFMASFSRCLDKGEGSYMAAAYCLGLLDEHLVDTTKGELSDDYINLIAKRNIKFIAEKYRPAYLKRPEKLVGGCFKFAMMRAFSKDNVSLVETLLSLMQTSVADTSTTYFFRIMLDMYQSDRRLSFGPNVLGFVLGLIKDRYEDEKETYFQNAVLHFINDDNVESIKAVFPLGLTAFDEKRANTYSGTDTMRALQRMMRIIENFDIVALTDKIADAVAGWLEPLAYAATLNIYLELKEWTLVSLRPDLMDRFNKLFTKELIDEAAETELLFLAHDSSRGRVRNLHGSHTVGVSVATLLAFFDATKSQGDRNFHLPRIARVYLDREWADAFVARFKRYKNDNPQRTVGIYIAFLQQLFRAVPDRTRYDDAVRYLLRQLQSLFEHEDWTALYVNVMAGMRSDVSISEVLAFSELGELARRVMKHMQLTHAAILRLRKESGVNGFLQSRHSIYREAYLTLVDIYKRFQTKMNYADYEYLFNYADRPLLFIEDASVEEYQPFHPTVALARVQEALTLLAPTALGHYMFNIAKERPEVPEKGLNTDSRVGRVAFILREQLKETRKAVLAHLADKTLDDYLYEDFVKFLEEKYTTFWSFLR